MHRAPFRAVGEEVIEIQLVFGVVMQPRGEGRVMLPEVRDIVGVHAGRDNRRAAPHRHFVSAQCVTTQQRERGTLLAFLYCGLCVTLDTDFPDFVRTGFRTEISTKSLPVHLNRNFLWSSFLIPALTRQRNHPSTDQSVTRVTAVCHGEARIHDWRGRDP